MEAIKAPTRRDQKLAKENLKVLERVAKKHKAKSKPIEIEITGEKTNIKIPSSALAFLNTIFEHMAKGKAISIIPSETEVSTQQAAEMLNVSRPHIVKLLERGEILFSKVGTHRRIKLKDLEHYREKSARERKKHLAELAKQAQKLDMGY